MILCFNVFEILDKIYKFPGKTNQYFWKKKTFEW